MKVFLLAAMVGIALTAWFILRAYSDSGRSGGTPLPRQVDRSAERGETGRGRGSSDDSRDSHDGRGDGGD